MKRFIIVLILAGAFFHLNSSENTNRDAKKFHFFYISFSDLSNKAYVINAISDSLSNFNDGKDEFVLFISNGKNSSFYNSSGSIKDIVTELNNINPYAPNLKSDFDKVIKYMDESGIIFTSDSNTPLELSYTSASFNYFLDEKYLKECQGLFFHRFNIINELNYLENKKYVSYTFLIEKNSREMLPKQDSDFTIKFYTFN